MVADGAVQAYVQVPPENLSGGPVEAIVREQSALPPSSSIVMAAGDLFGFPLRA